MWLALFATAGCQDSDPAPDGGPKDGGATAVDAPAAICTAPGECPCFSNYDCPESHACTSLDDTGENVWCLEGPRGIGVAGVPCEVETDCASALCVEDASGAFRCSDLCEEPEDCPDELPRCLFIGFGVDESICAPP